MRNTFTIAIWVLMIGLCCQLLPRTARAQEDGRSSQILFGIKIKAGGRFDNVRMCVASPAGAKGGPALSMTFYSEIALTDQMSLSVDLPVFRPILFAAAFKMLQFEPEVSLLFRAATGDKIDFIAGPTAGVSFHYGPDYHSERSGEGRGKSFFAMGPRLGTFLGMDFKRQGKTMNYRLGLQPYVTPMFGVNDPDHHKGVVIGATLDNLFRFSAIED